MKTMVVGDIHGCGLELRELIQKAGLDPVADQLVLIGDLFDRAKHAHVVWQVIHEWGDRCYCLMGNHERKMLNFILKQREGLPRHYYWAMDDLRRIGVLESNLRAFLERLPTILVWLDGQIVQPGDKPVLLDGNPVIIVHAGVDIHWPLNPDPTYTVYGNRAGRDGIVPWWDKYTGPNLVLYGHLSERDHQPRIRTANPYKVAGDSNLRVEDVYDSRIAPINSIGLDTACCHGGSLTGYIIETREFISVKAHKDWSTELKREVSDSRL